MRHTVSRKSTLGECLRVLFQDSSGRTLKQLLETGRVRVNGAIEKIARAALEPGDVVEVGREPIRTTLPPGLSIVHEDDDLIVVEKGPNLLTIATDKERERTAYAYLSSHVKRRRRRARVFIVHRLDQLASGLLVFAKSEEAKRALQAQFEAHTVEREYVAVVEGKLETSDGILRSRLVESPGGRVLETRSRDRGRLAVTRYRVIGSGARFSTVEVRLETGRKHQIRVQVAGIGHPIVGDAAYGSRVDPIGRIALHARTLGFDHPRTGERLRFKSEPPASFAKLVR